MTDDGQSGAAVRDTMRAVRLHTPRGPEGLVFEEIETPSVRAGDAFVKVHAAAITRGELDWPVDRLPAIPSYELSGVVAAVGPSLDTVSIGEPVYALTPFDRDGVAAEYAAVPANVLAPRPSALDHVESAAIPLAALSAWQGLFDWGGLNEAQRVLIHGAAGGVGHFATQLARWRGAYVIGTASGANQEYVLRLGAHEVIDPSRSRLDEALGPVDLVFDIVGGDLLRRLPAVVRAGGKLVSVAEEPPDTPAGSIEALYFVVEPNRAQLIELTRLVDGGELNFAIDSVYPLADARAAFERSMARGKSGKVILRVSND